MTKNKLELLFASMFMAWGLILVFLSLKGGSPLMAFVIAGLFVSWYYQSYWRLNK